MTVITWIFSKDGQNNSFYLNEKVSEKDQAFLFKVPLANSQYSDINRTVSLWNKVNPSQYQAQINNSIVIEGIKKNGYITPWLTGEEPSDAERAVFLINTFNRTKIILPAALNEKSMVKPKGRAIVCTEVDSAFSLNKPNEDAWNKIEIPPSADYPLTSATLKSLIFIQHNLPGRMNVDFLILSLPYLTKKFAEGYDLQKNNQNPEQVQEIVSLLHKAAREGDKWKKLNNGGTYNHVFRSDDGYVLKIQKIHGNTLTVSDNPDRSVRLWNEINKGLTALAQLYKEDELHINGWICPYIKGKTAADEETANLILDVFNNTGRIIIDAVSNNVLKTKDNQLICIDIGMAVQIESRLHHRRMSQDSLLVWKENKKKFNKSYFPKFMDKEQDFYSPHSIATIKALLLIKRWHKDLADVAFLKGDFQFINKLAWCYDQNTLGNKFAETEINQIFTALLQKKPYSQCNDWALLNVDAGDSSHNTVYLSKDRKYIFKLRKSSDGAADNPQRAVDLWKEINAAALGKTNILTVEGLGNGWICPYIEGSQASDTEIAAFLIRLFNKTGRIILDAVGRGNVLKTQSNELVCVDVGLAVQLDKREEVNFNGMLRRKSITSLDIWRNNKSDYLNYFKEAEERFQCPLAIATTKALLFIKLNRPDIYQVDFLQNCPQFVMALAKGYDLQMTNKQSESAKVLESLDNGINLLATLEKEHPITLENIKISCIAELERYINSRGSINDKKQFQPSFTTRLFRYVELTRSKVAIAQQLMDKIKRATSMDELQQAIVAAEKVPDALLSRFTSGLGTSLGRCLWMVSSSIVDLDVSLTRAL